VDVDVEVECSLTSQTTSFSTKTNCKSRFHIPELGDVKHVFVIYVCQGLAKSFFIFFLNFDFSCL
jgi:hypothetical protein